VTYLYASKTKAGVRFRFQFSDYLGRRRTGTLPGCRSKEEAQREADRIQHEHTMVSKGYLPVPEQWQRQSTERFHTVLNDYLDEGKRAGGRRGFPWGETHARMQATILAWWGSTLRLTLIRDLRGILPRVEKELRTLENSGLAPKTLANRGAALKAFCGWCSDRTYLKENPLKRLKLQAGEPDVKRRALTIDEIRRLFDVAAPYRRLLYEVALTTGLRAKELRMLTPDHLDAENGGLRLEAAWTKNRQAGFQRLPRRIIGEIQAFIESGAVPQLYARACGKAPFPDDPLLFVPKHTGEMIAADLDRAGIPKLKAGIDGGKADFHGLRTTFITMLMECGGTLKECMVAARHNSPTLTLNTYGRARIDRLSELAESIGDIILPPSDDAQSAQRAELRKAVGAENDGPQTGYGDRTLVGEAGFEPTTPPPTADSDTGHSKAKPGHGKPTTALNAHPIPPGERVKWTNRNLRRTDGGQNRYAKSAHAINSNDKKLAELLTAWQRLTPGEREAVLHVARFHVKRKPDPKDRPDAGENGGRQ